MTYTNILIIKIRAMGDTLLSTPTISALRQAYPKAKLTYLVSPVGYPILENNVDLNHVQVFNKSMNLINYGHFISQLRAAHYDLVINLHASFRTALITKLSGAQNRIVHNHSGKNYFSTIAITAKKEAKSTIERDLDAIRALGITTQANPVKFNIDKQVSQHAEDFLQEHQVNRARGFMLLAPGAGKQKKQWSIEHCLTFLKLAQKQSKVPWILLAGPDEHAFVHAVEQTFGQVVPIFRGSLKEAGALIACAKGMITTDSGPKHLACSQDTKTLTLWTDEPIAEWHPYDQKQHDIVISTTGQVADLEPQLVWEKAISHFPFLQQKSV